MGLLDRLIVTNAAAPEAGADLTVDVSGASDAQVLGTLVSAFGADESCREIQVRRDGVLLGSVNRDATIAFVGDGLKGVGASDAMLLPGVGNYSTTHWVCPRRDCGYSLVTIVFDDAPNCARHPDQPLVLQG
jgi:hypothetical protein